MARKKGVSSIVACLIVTGSITISGLSATANVSDADHLSSLHSVYRP
jgi:hypothetical protein